MYFEFARRIYANEQMFKDCATVGFDSQMDSIAICDAIMRSIRWSHVDMPFGANHALSKLDNTFGANEDTSWSPFEFSASANRNVQTQGNSIGKCQLHLACGSCWAQHPNGRATSAFVDQPPSRFLLQRKTLLDRALSLG